MYSLKANKHSSPNDSHISSQLVSDAFSNAVSLYMHQKLCSECFILIANHTKHNWAHFSCLEESFYHLQLFIIIIVFSYFYSKPFT